MLDIADYVIGYEIKSKEAVKTARYAIMDSVGREEGRGRRSFVSLPPEK